MQTHFLWHNSLFWDILRYHFFVFHFSSFIYDLPGWDLRKHLTVIDGRVCNLKSMAVTDTQVFLIADGLIISSTLLSATPALAYTVLNNMEKLVKAVEKLTGEKFMVEMLTK